MNTNFLRLHFFGIFALLAMLASFGAAVMLLWNALLPSIVGLPTIDYFQAVGLVLLARILFGIGNIRGDFPMGGGHRSHDRNFLRERWRYMSEEERQKFTDYHHFFHGQLKEMKEMKKDIDKNGHEEENHVSSGNNGAKFD